MNQITKLSFLFFTFLSTFLSLGQTIFTNPLTFTSAVQVSPYTAGQTVDPNITVSGIVRGSGIAGAAAANRYSANSWSTSALDLNDYFEFTLTPNATYEIDFTNFVYTSQVSTGTPNHVFRSSLDGFTTNIGTTTTTGTTISLGVAAYQNITTPITFRFYLFGAAAASTTFSINDFTFNGSVTSSCTAPATPATSFSASTLGSNSALINWVRGSGNNVMVVARTVATATDPTSNTTYTPNATYGMGSAVGLGWVVYDGTGTSVTVTNLLPNTTYNFDLYEYNTSGICFNTTELSGSALTNCVAPSTQASFGTNVPTTTTASIAITAGNGLGRLVKINTTNTFTDPTDGSTFTANLGYTTGEQVIAAGTATPIVVTGLLPATTYYVAVYEYNCTGTRIVYNTVENTSSFTTASLAPEIEVRGNTNFILDNATTTTATNFTQFANTNWGSSNTRTFVINNIGTAQLNLTGTPLVNISGANASDFSVTTLPTTPLASTIGTTTFVITFSPSGLGLRSATVSIANNDSDENLFDFAISGTGLASNTSEIISANGETSIISSLSTSPTIITTNTQGILVWQFVIKDGGASADADNLNTIINTLQLTQNAGNSIDDWSDAIQSVALFNGATFIANGVLASNSITFTGSPLLSIPDDGSITLSLRLTLQTAPNNSGTNLDNDDFVFNATYSNMVLGSGSLFPSSGFCNSANGQNVLSVVATQLAFVQQPSNTSVNSIMTPSVTISAVDANGNRDRDYTSGVNITSLGTLTGTPNMATAVLGLATFSNLIHSAIGTTLSLTAVSGSLGSASSGLFDITDFTYTSGDIRPLYSTDLSINGSWEYFNGTSWLTSGGGYDGKAPQNTSTLINRVIINTYVSGGGSASKAYNCDFIIQSGGELEVVENITTPSAEMIAANKKIEVLSGGILTISGDIDVATTAKIIVRNGGEMYLNQPSINNSHTMWDGTELFEGESNVIIWDWDWAASATNRSLFNIATKISDNANGYKFGNLLVEISPTNSFTIVGGGIGIINLCENNFEIYNTSSFYVLGATNSSGTNGFIVNGNMTIYEGPFSFGSSFSNASFNHQFTINGNFECASSYPLKTHNIGSGTPINLSGSVNFKKDVIISNTVTEFSSDLGSGSPKSIPVNFNGNGVSTNTFQTVSIQTSIAANENKNINFNVLSDAYVKLASNLNCNNTTLNIATGGVFNNGGENQILAASGTNSITVSGRFITQDTQGFNGTGATIPTITPTLNGGSFVEFAKLGNQIITNFSPKYKNVDITGTGTKTLGNATDIWIDENLQVLSSTLMINTNEALTVNKAVKVTAGDFEIKNSGSLIQIDNSSTNSGNIKMDRTATNIKRQDYVYWSSPVSGFLSTAVSPNTSLAHQYTWTPTISGNTNGFGAWANANETMTLGKGYALRGPDTFSLTIPSNHTATFVGVPNNGIITIPIKRGTYDGANYNNGASTTPGTKNDDNWNLIGNPFPSAIDAIDFLTLNTNIEGFVNIWTHGTGISAANTDPFYNDFVYNYSASDYVTYNATGASSGPTTFNGRIAAGQGFFVCMKHTSAATTENVTFNNALRNKTYNNSQFFRSAIATTNSVNLEKNRIWIDVLSETGATARSMFGYIENATNEKDRLFDAFSNEKLSFNIFSLLNNEQMLIQGKALPFHENDIVPIGISIPQNGTYKIALAAVDGLFANPNQEIYLEDKELQIIYNLRTAPYTFTANQGIHKTRFEIRYTNAALPNESFSNNNTVNVFVQNEEIKIKATEEIEKIEIFDVLGRNIYNNLHVKNNSINIATVANRNQALFVKVTFTTGNVATTKIIK